MTVSIRELAQVIGEIDARTARIDQQVEQVSRNLDGATRMTRLPSGVTLGNAVQQILESVQVIRRDVDGNPNS